jgi:hypothetical protein
MHSAQNRSSAFRLGLAALVAAACTCTSFGQMSLVANSPFAASGTAVAVGSAPAQDFELAGSSASGSDVTVCIFERQAKRSAWIPVGGNVDGIHVISFDSAHDLAVVTVGGQRREISMRKAVIASSNNSAPSRPRQDLSVPNALVPVVTSQVLTLQTPPPPATGPEQEQREARMLVSDLLEIGVQQRKAYQDAKLKAAAGTPPTPEN